MPSILLDFHLVHELPLLAQRALLETRADGVAIALREGSEYVCRATAGVMAPGIGVRLRNDTGITAACIRSAQAVVCADAASDERVNAAACQELGIASIMVVPIHDGDTMVGILEALSQTAGAFGAAEQAVLESVANEIGELTPGQVHDDVAGTPYVAAVTRSAESETDMPAIANESAADVVADAEQGNESLRDRLANSAIRAPLVICALMVAGLLMMFGPGGAHEASAAEQLSARISTLPLRQPASLAPLGLAPRPGRQAAAWKNGDGSMRALEASARAGEASAQVRLADALASGAGVASDPVAAEAWYIVAHLAGENSATRGMRSLSQRLSNSQTAAVRERLATMYEEGIGVRRDRTAAYCWLTLAEAAGAKGVGARKQRLARGMASSQIEEANLRAQEWLKQHRQLMAQGN